MTNFFDIDLNRVLTGAVGALLLSSACVGAAVAPAHAVETGAGVQMVEVAAAGEAQA